MSTATPIPVRSPLPGALSGATVVLVGGSSGIGLAAAVLLRSIGARVVLVGRDPDRLEAAASRVRGSGPDDAVLGVTGDGGDERTLAEAFDRAGRVDHVYVTAGGISGAGPLAALSADDIRTTLGSGSFRRPSRSPARRRPGFPRAARSRSARASSWSAPLPG